MPRHSCCVHRQCLFAHPTRHRSEPTGSSKRRRTCEHAGCVLPRRALAGDPIASDASCLEVRGWAFAAGARHALVISDSLFLGAPLPAALVRSIAMYTPHTAAPGPDPAIIATLQPDAAPPRARPAAGPAAGGAPAGALSGSGAPARAAVARAPAAGVAARGPARSRGAPPASAPGSPGRAAAGPSGAKAGSAAVMPTGGPGNKPAARGRTPERRGAPAPAPAAVGPKHPTAGLQMAAYSPEAAGQPPVSPLSAHAGGPQEAAAVRSGSTQAYVPEEAQGGPSAGRVAENPGAGQTATGPPALNVGGYPGGEQSGP